MCLNKLLLSPTRLKCQHAKCALWLTDQLKCSLSKFQYNSINRLSYTYRSMSLARNTEFLSASLLPMEDKDLLIVCQQYLCCWWPISHIFSRQHFQCIFLMSALLSKSHWSWLLQWYTSFWTNSRVAEISGATTLLWPNATSLLKTLLLIDTLYESIFVAHTFHCYI